MHHDPADTSAKALTEPNIRDGNGSAGDFRRERHNSVRILETESTVSLSVSQQMQMMEV